MPVARPALAGGRACISSFSGKRPPVFAVNIQRPTPSVERPTPNAQHPTLNSESVREQAPNAEWRTNDRRSIPPKLLSAEQSGFYLVGKEAAIQVLAPLGSVTSQLRTIGRVENFSQSSRGPLDLSFQF